MAPSARAFGAGLRPWPSATISYHLSNFWHPGALLRRRRRVALVGSAGRGGD